MKTIVFRVFVFFVLLVLYRELNSSFNWNWFAVALILSVLFIVIDPKEVKVYKRKLRVQRNFLFGLFNYSAYFDLANIEKLKVTGKFTEKSDITQDVLSIFLPVPDRVNTLQIKTKDGLFHLYNLKIYKEQLEEAVETFQASKA